MHLAIAIVCLTDDALNQTLPLTPMADSKFDPEGNLAPKSESRKWFGSSSLLNQ
jgi:hypothetical protein